MIESSITYELRMRRTNFRTRRSSENAQITTLSDMNIIYVEDMCAESWLSMCNGFMSDDRSRRETTYVEIFALHMTCSDLTPYQTCTKI